MTASLRPVRLLAAALLALAAPGVGRAGDLVLRVGYIRAGSKGPTGAEGWAAHIGLLQRELAKLGVREIRWLGFPNGPDVNEALAAGELDIASYGDTPCILGRAAGLRTRVIAQTSVGSASVLVARPGGPRSVSELRGRTVGAPKGSNMHHYLIGVLKEAGLLGKVKVVHLLNRDADAALTHGDIDAYAISSSLGLLLADRGLLVIDDGARHPSLRGTSLSVARDDIIARRPDVIERWVELRSQAASDLRARPDAYYQFAAAAADLPERIVRAATPVEQVRVEPFTPEGLALLEGTKAFLEEQGFTKDRFEIGDWILREKMK